MPFPMLFVVMTALSIALFALLWVEFFEGDTARPRVVLAFFAAVVPTALLIGLFYAFNTHSFVWYGVAREGVEILRAQLLPVQLAPNDLVIGAALLFGFSLVLALMLKNELSRKVMLRMLAAVAFFSFLGGVAVLQSMLDFTAFHMEDDERVSRPQLTALQTGHLMAAMTGCPGMIQLQPGEPWLCPAKDKLTPIAPENYAALTVVAERTVARLIDEGCIGVPGSLLNPVYCRDATKRETLAQHVMAANPPLADNFGECSASWGDPRAAVADNIAAKLPGNAAYAVKFEVADGLTCAKVGRVTRKFLSNALIYAKGSAAGQQ